MQLTAAAAAAAAAATARWRHLTFDILQTYTTDRALQTQQTLLRKHKLPGTNFPADHDRRHISTSGTAKNAASSLRLESMGNRVDRCRKVVRAIRDFTAETQTAGDKLSTTPASPA